MYKHHRFTTYVEKIRETGLVSAVNGAIVTVVNLPGLKVGEAVVFEHDGVGKTMVLKPDGAEVLLFSHDEVEVGTRVARTGERVQTYVGDELLGKQVNGLGVYEGEMIPEEPEWRVIESMPLPVGARSRIIQPLMSGVGMVDLVVPLGKGQRELLLGDQKTGKTHFALEVIRHQVAEGVLCVYAAIGKTAAEIVRIKHFLMNETNVHNTVLVAVDASASAGEIFLAPYTAMTIAEYFKDTGRDVVVVLDDLLTHAKFYREISLLARRFPGRDSYPGDIFHIHSRLLERAGSFAVGERQVTISCLPIADTVASDMAGYVQTNLMSMTDGHLFFDRDLFFRGNRPAINPFLSVTRVGRQTQTPLRQELSRRIIAFLADYENAKRFVRFGSDLPQAVQATINRGRHLWQLFDEDAMVDTSDSFRVVMASLLVHEEKGLKEELSTWVEEYMRNQEWQDRIELIIANCETVAEVAESARTQLHIAKTEADALHD